MPTTEATLAQVRRSVRVRASLDSYHDAPSMYDMVVDEYIRASHRRLSAEFPWLRTYLRSEQVIIPEHTRYAIPDRMTVRGFVSVLVRHTERGEYALRAGMSTGERRLAERPSSGSAPEMYRVIEREIEIQPAPDDRYTHVIIEGYLEGTPREDTDLISIDEEALVMSATLDVQQHYGMPVTELEILRFSRYLDRTRGEQSIGDGFVFGAQRPRRELRHRPRGLGDDWTPW